MSEARTEVLRRVRAALRDAPPVGEVVRGYERRLPVGTVLVELFANRVADYRAEVVRTPRSELAQTISRALRDRQAKRIAVPPGLPNSWLAEADVQTAEDSPPLSHTQLDAVDGVVTSCSVAIAETGTIVLDGGPGQGRRALSLLPDYHLCIVAEEQIVGTLSEALERLDPRRPQTWISGPSATSDIELQRVEGVHGPRSLEVLIVRGDPGIESMGAARAKVAG